MQYKLSSDKVNIQNVHCIKVITVLIELKYEQFLVRLVNGSNHF